MRQLSGVIVNRLQALAAARGSLLPWAPVILSLGIGTYFALPAEPSVLTLALLSALTLALAWVALRGHQHWQVPAIGLALVLGGLLLAGLRAHLVAAPVLPFRYYGPIEGRVVGIDRSFSDQPRLTLDRVVLEDVSAARTPARVRIALHGDAGEFQAEPGQTVMLTGHLAPPDGPVEPGSFDFQRLAWFSSLGAVGYTRTPVMLLEPPEPGLAMAAFQLRMKISRAMQDRMAGQAGAFAAALMTGDRSGVTAATNAALRASNLSHMISISGLHMGLLTGFVFALCRYGLALVPFVALRLNSKKLAAMVALLAATFYLALAGPDVATRRSYIMAAVMLAAILADRRAISLRTVAIAALICLGLEPESLVEPGFQMSFGATVALIVGFEHWAKVQDHLPLPLRPLALMILSSLIAGLATAPISAAHFNRIAEYGLLANLLAVPVMGMVVMPAGVIAAILVPLGLAQPALWAMEQGTALILMIADWVAAMDGALIAVPAPPRLVLPLFGIGGAALLIGSGRWLRLAGAGGSVLALALWVGAERPLLLVSGDGTLVGLMTPQGRALSKEKGGGFVAQNWLENDGDTAMQAEAFVRTGFEGANGARSAEIAGLPLRVFTGKGAAGRAAGACSDNAIVILSEDWPAAGGACQILDLASLRISGALAFYPSASGLVRVSAHDLAGDRLWNAKPQPRRRYASAPPE